MCAKTVHELSTSSVDYINPNNVTIYREFFLIYSYILQVSELSYICACVAAVFIAVYDEAV